MARAPLLQLSGISLAFGGDRVFDDLSLVVHEGDALALVGRNGEGKSTLMKVMAGLAQPDSGAVITSPGTSAGYMEQDPDLSGFATLGDFALRDLGPAELWRVEAAAEGLGFDPARDAATASGGERRRAALAKLLGEGPDLMLLDEPTNHLDIRSIAWLEGELARRGGARIVISHDRAFLRAVAKGVLWIDRGAVRRMDRPYERFEDWRDEVWAQEDLERHKTDRRIKAEARWAVEGISGRRKRNQGRLRALREMQADRAAQVRRAGTAALALDEGARTGKRVIEARGIAKSYDGRPVIRPFDLRFLRGDRIAFVGPNGAGKTTLLKMLTGEVAPDEGSVKRGAGIEMAVFDQNREALQPGITLWETLAGDPEVGAAGRSDQVMVRGAPRHVVGYLKDFLFDEAQARAPVRSLSGGEKARLLLAKLFAKPSNLLVLDEPTNDLDVETLDLLQEVLGDYPGTVLLVSHDRDFVDRVATTTVRVEDGRATAYAGGWTDHLAQRREGEGEGEGPAGPARSAARPAAKAAEPAERSKPQPPKDGITFTERHRLDALPAEIDRLGAEIGKLEGLLATPNLYETARAKFEKATEALVARQAALAAAEEEWLALAEKAEG
ncbi:ATP-binding cassette subfamily F protein uup [Hasllibacter halocynthiae]|uniref:ATP-binding cassette subfamily F protein uup n=1 Tax=Hasllibacter halocynthiae TaxID=595589 RepID=A0A2T0X902_9RHOB|nr:ABC-F family ATP-binding cassette domain-containing protein [Hasllibacter halocynthiae]PRY95344.1 ATP-binding cassette subfamily F protein uup [Hasllibacter halocynthiae]